MSKEGRRKKGEESPLFSGICICLYKKSKKKINTCMQHESMNAWDGRLNHVAWVRLEEGHLWRDPCVEIWGGGGWWESKRKAEKLQKNKNVTKERPCVEGDEVLVEGTCHANLRNKETVSWTNHGTNTPYSCKALLHIKEYSNTKSYCISLPLVAYKVDKRVWDCALVDPPYNLTRPL